MPDILHTLPKKSCLNRCFVFLFMVLSGAAGFIKLLIEAVAYGVRSQDAVDGLDRVYTALPALLSRSPTESCES
jgi:hypothetical protein